MKLTTNTNIRKVVIIIAGVLLTVVLYQIFWKADTSTPIGNLRLQPKAERELADGIWGSIGFYADPKDNIVTFGLIALVFFSIIYRFVVKPYNRYVKKPLTKSNQSKSNNGKPKKQSRKKV